MRLSGSSAGVTDGHCARIMRLRPDKCRVPDSSPWGSAVRLPSGYGSGRSPRWEGSSGVDPVAVRVGYAILAFVSGSLAVLAYPVLWILMPDE
jgi:hypothetical protein